MAFLIGELSCDIPGNASYSAKIAITGEPVP
jgi:hypothetical protein